MQNAQLLRRCRSDETAEKQEEGSADGLRDVCTECMLLGRL